MDYRMLAECSDTAIKKIFQQINDEGSSEVLESIKQQMIFIRDNALEGKNPALALEAGRQFTYGILASREFASPKELELKEYIDKVSRVLDDD
ncbi:MAG TPA: hypothetical protein ENI64_12175 [Gammaproteobacteria bacterium]|nr:hypothetical protein [Gammaproteobacteria bacterium]